jgi:electron transport complex protein RnfB
MSEKFPRRKVLGTAARGAALVGLAGLTGVLTLKANKTYAWAIDTGKCVNSKLGALGVEICELCATDCVLTLSAVRAVNEFSECGRCYICPAYFDVQSAVGADGLPSEKLCPRDAIERKAIGSTPTIRRTTSTSTRSTNGCATAAAAA